MAKKIVQKQCEQTEQTLYKRTDGSLSQNTERCLVNALGIWDSSCGVYDKEELVAKGCSVGDLVLSGNAAFSLKRFIIF